MLKDSYIYFVWKFWPFFHLFYVPIFSSTLNETLIFHVYFAVRDEFLHQYERILGLKQKVWWYIKWEGYDINITIALIRRCRKHEFHSMQDLYIWLHSPLSIFRVLTGFHWIFSSLISRQLGTLTAWKIWKKNPTFQRSLSVGRLLVLKPGDAYFSPDSRNICRAII